jgi:hypothetical protein
MIEDQDFKGRVLRQVVLAMPVIIVVAAILAVLLSVHGLTR